MGAHSGLPRLSIVTPNFNNGAYLEETIQSVLEQQYPELEYIIVDGGSTDRSLEIIKKYEKFLAYWVSEPDRGLYHAVQKGFERSSGEVMAWINSDDLYHRNAFLTVGAIFSKFPQVKWLQGRPTAIDEAGRTVCVEALRDWSRYDFYLRDFQWIHDLS